MEKNLLLTNLVDNYSFVNTKVFMTAEINSLFRSYALNTGNEITEILFIPYAYDGTEIILYIGKVQELFGTVNLKNITEGNNPIEMIRQAQAIVIGGGRMDLLENSLNIDMRNEIKIKIDAKIPYIGWNEGSVIACPTKIEDLGTVSNDLIAAVPFQFVCQYDDNPANRISIEDFMRNNPNIKNVVCFSDQVPPVAAAHSVPGDGDIVEDSDNNTTAANEGSGIRIVKSKAGLAGTQSAATVILYQLDDNGNLIPVPNPDISVII